MSLVSVPFSKNISFLIHGSDDRDKLIRVAKTIDEHLAKSSVNSKDRVKPHIGPSIKPMHVEVGRAFTIKLREHNSLHEVKPSEIDDPSLVIQVANGSASGEYPFFAMKAGKTKIRLLAAHATLLTVAFQDVEVEIEQRANKGTGESIMTLPVARQRPLRLLSLDQNAITVLTSLTILQRIFQQVSVRVKRTVEPWEVFDLIGGAATGG
jgi:hypothetical protein